MICKRNTLFCERKGAAVIWKFSDLDIYKEQVKEMWERFSTATSNAAAESRFHEKRTVPSMI